MFTPPGKVVAVGCKVNGGFQAANTSTFFLVEGTSGAKASSCDSMWFGDDKESDVTREEATYLGRESQGKKERGAESEGRDPAVRRGV